MSRLKSLCKFNAKGGCYPSGEHFAILGVLPGSDIALYLPKHRIREKHHNKLVTPVIGFNMQLSSKSQVLFDGIKCNQNEMIHGISVHLPLKQAVLLIIFV